MFYREIGGIYSGIQIRKKWDIEALKEWSRYVIKPDMLFWKRWKRGLLGINLSKQECKNWLDIHFKKQENIDGVDGSLDIFLAEEVVDIRKEYYLSFAQSRDGDVVTFSPDGGVDIEENWNLTKSVTIPVDMELSWEHIEELIWKGISQNTAFTDLIRKLWIFYKSYGFVSLECNPIAEDTDGVFHMIDAVAKVDDQEEYLQKSHWKDLEIPNNYGFQENAAERYIKELDNQTGASLKMKILNPNAQIWTLFAGGGGSLVMTDTLGALWYADNIWNYGECSGNPSREFTYEYTKTLLWEMLNSKVSLEEEDKTKWQKQSSKKYLIIAGAIANFTHIDKTFAGIIDALEENIQEIHKQECTILVRRGWINEKKGLLILKEACERLEIPAVITGSDTYMTEILKQIKL